MDKIKVLLIVLLSLPAANNALAQSTATAQVQVRVEAPIAESWRYPVRQGAGFALINEGGELVAGALFDAVRPFSGDLGAARQDHLWGFVDGEGNWVIEPAFQEADDFLEGRARVLTPEGWILIDTGGRQITGRAYVAMTPLGDGLAAYQADASTTRRGRPGQWGVLSADGVELSGPMFDGAGLPHAGRIPAERYRKLLFLRLEKRWGFVDSHGEWAIDPVFNSVRSFSEGLALVSDGRTGRFIGPQGDTLLTVPFPIVHSFSEGLARVGEAGRLGFIGRSGEVVITPTYEAAGDFSHGRAAVRLDGLWGYLDTEGRMTIPARFQLAGRFKGPLARVVEQGVEMYVNQTGIIVWPTR
jgi:WG containing repeat